MNALMQAARRYTELGISVLPVAPNTKFPDAEALRRSGTRNFLGQLSWQPLTRRVATEAELRAWFENGGRNLGIVTGFRDIVVLDFDGAEHYETWRQMHGQLRTCKQDTAHGVHVLFRWKGAGQTRFFINNDFVLTSDRSTRVGQIKGGSDYVLAWPSIHPDGTRYRWRAGHAPWEMEILRVESLTELGVEPVRKRWSSYLELIPRLLLEPRRSVPFVERWIKNKYAKLAGVFFRYG